MKVFHGPSNISGMAGILAKQQQLLGVDSLAYSYPNPYNYKSDREFYGPQNLLKYLRFMLLESWTFDVYQFYFGHSLTHNYLKEIALLKKLRKKLFFYFCGCDIRDSKKVIQNYKYSACKECWPMACSPNRMKAKHLAQTYANQVFVSTPDLLEFVDNAVLLPQPIELDFYQKIRGATSIDSNKNLITIVHAPSSSRLKGTSYIETAIANLKAAGLPIEFILLENKRHQEVIETCAKADIIIDQLLIGAYGQFSVEAMALGKPVICYIRDDLIDLYPAKLPLVNANIETIESVILSLIKDPQRREQIGNDCLDYAHEVHDSRIIAEKSLSYYLS